MKLSKLLCCVLLVVVVLAGCVPNNGNDELEYHGSFNDPCLTEAGPLDPLIDAITAGGKSLISTVAAKAGSACFNLLLKAMGFDMRSVEEKKIDEVNAKVDVLQSTVQAGFERVTRNQVRIHNEDVMNELLAKVNEVRSPILDKMLILADISAKELDETYDWETLTREQETLAKDLADLRFSTLSENDIWYATENLANAILTPSYANVSVQLFDLYEETYGALETWDTMTVKPRREFIAYLAYLVNSMCQLSQISANYKISLYPEGDANIKGIESGVNRMIEAVGNLNEKFSEELKNLAEIQRQHDEDKIMVHRNRVADEYGNLVVVKDDPISSRLMPVTTGESEYNYVSFEADDSPMMVNYTGYNHFIYHLNGQEKGYLYQNVVSEYKIYNASMGYTDYTTFTVKDYLSSIGFNCNEIELYEKAVGFYGWIGHVIYEASGGVSNTFSKLAVAYFPFRTADQDGDVAEYDSVNYYLGWWSRSWTYERTDKFDNFYLCFVNADQKTLYGKIDKLIIQYNGEKEPYGFYQRHYKGYYHWSEDQGTLVPLQEKHL